MAIQNQDKERRVKPKFELRSLKVCKDPSPTPSGSSRDARSHLRGLTCRDEPDFRDQQAAGEDRRLYRGIQVQVGVFEKLEQCVGGVEQRAAASETAAESSVGQVQPLEQRIWNLEEQIDDLDNWGRRKDIRLLGLPEQEEEGHLVDFLEQ
ncbi:hypothetical protein chiPu_0011833 [Chiloscyllium punctatum]|uniref:Uncharacterized protein n=1 Tax=Chiloscyllium punctatum TaxID=137246 RepID=A0A401SSH5_CHIPU|nr:hypothetical protein [Chiloscyllium punctatum]